MVLNIKATPFIPLLKIQDIKSKEAPTAVAEEQLSSRTTPGLDTLYPESSPTDYLSELLSNILMLDDSLVVGLSQKRAFNLNIYTFLLNVQNCLKQMKKEAVGDDSKFEPVLILEQQVKEAVVWKAEILGHTGVAERNRENPLAKRHPKYQKAKPEILC